jgi:hypothetical protein
MTTRLTVYAHQLTPEQQRDARNSLIFIMEKRCGRIKSRAYCVDGSAQRAGAEKGAATSPTVTNDSVLIT